MLEFATLEGGEEVLRMRSSFPLRPSSGDNTTVMMRWEKEYMEALVDALALTEDDDVLEIGFGLGFSAAAIQARAPRSHTIIECDAMVLARLRGWAHGRRGVRVVAGTWQAHLGCGGSGCSLQEQRFDAVFFDDFPLPSGSAGSGDGTESRWRTFLRALARSALLNEGARVSGYLARTLGRELEGIGFATRSMGTCAVEVPMHCPYLPAGRTELLVPVLTKEVAERASKLKRKLTEEEGVTAALEAAAEAAISSGLRLPSSAAVSHADEAKAGAGAATCMLAAATAAGTNLNKLKLTRAAAPAVLAQPKPKRQRLRLPPPAFAAVTADHVGLDC